MSTATMSTKSKSLRAGSTARYGCYLGLVIGIGLILHGLNLLWTGSNPLVPYQVAVLGAGVVECIVCTFALQANRAAWSFALSMNGFLGLAFLIGSPQVREGWNVSIPLSFVPAVLMGVTTILLALGSEDY